MTLLVGIAVIVLVGWWLSVLRFPVRRCPACKGSRRNAGSTSKRWGPCYRCGGKGYVRRLGAGPPPPPPPPHE